MEKRKHCKPEVIIPKLHAIDIHLQSGLSVKESVRKAEIADVTSCKWKKNFSMIK